MYNHFWQPAEGVVTDHLLAIFQFVSAAQFSSKSKFTQFLLNYTTTYAGLSNA